jgi:hypothetical protein
MQQLVAPAVQCVPHEWDLLYKDPKDISQRTV